jgi:hypothetical protein
MDTRNELTEYQKEFVRAYIVLGDATEAYLASFPTENRRSAMANAHKLLTKSKIREAIKAETDSRITSFAPAALKTLTDIASNQTHKDASANAKHVLALAGYQPHQIIEVHKIDTASKIKAITAMVSTLAGLGMVIDLTKLVPATLIPSITSVDDEFIGA